MGTCHGALSGKGGFRLSLRGDDPVFDRTMITRDALGRRVDANRPERSLLVLKPSVQVPHVGGRRFGADSASFATMTAWIAGGSIDDAQSVAPLERLEIHPRERVLAAPERTQQLAVTAVFADGARPGEADAFVTIGLQMYFGDKMLMAQNRARVRCEYGRLPDGRCAEEEVGQTGPGAPGGTGGPGGGGAGPGS